MNIADIATYFRNIADEPDKTFLTDAELSVLLEAAWKQYMAIIHEADEEAFTGILNVTMTGTTVDLTVAPYNLLSNTIAFNGSGKMVRLQSVIKRDSTSGVPSFVYQAAHSLDEWAQSSDSLYILSNKTLSFNRSLAGDDITLVYTYLPTIDWTKIDSTAVGYTVQYPDEFDFYHDIIALLTYKQYAIKDATQNIPMLQHLSERIAEMKGFFQKGQSFSGNQYVSRSWRRF